MSAPVIGVCAAYERARWSFWDMEAAIVPSSYLAHIVDAGGVPAGMIPSQVATRDPEALLGRVDGLLLLGGVDVDPSTYGEEPSSKLETVAPKRDWFEIALTRRAFARDLPILGICRGMHIMNVAGGGTLHQHLDDAGYTGHRKAPGRLDKPSFHEVSVASGSWAAEGLGGGERVVNSHHHQGIRKLAKGAIVAARASADNLPEAIEWRTHSFALGVQWHPEALELGGVIKSFVSACWQRSSQGSEITMSRAHH